MTHTIRIYNRLKVKKAQRYNADTGYGIGIPYTKKSWICMGKCQVCRDVNREPWLVRKRNKEEFRMELRLMKDELVSIMSEDYDYEEGEKD